MLLLRPSPRGKPLRGRAALFILAPAGSGLQKTEIRDAIRTPLEPSSQVEILIEGTDFDSFDPRAAVSRPNPSVSEGLRRPSSSDGFSGSGF